MMKYYIFGFILSLNFFYGSCGVNYDIIIESVEYTTHGNDYIKWNFQVLEYNKTINIMNGDITILKDISALMQVHLVAYEKRGNDYQKALVDVTMNICEFIKESHVEQIFINKSNFPRDCPIPAGVYKLNEMNGAADNLPEKMNGRYWKLEITILADDGSLSVVEIFARIEKKRKTKNPNI